MKYVDQVVRSTTGSPGPAFRSGICADLPRGERHLESLVVQGLTLPALICRLDVHDDGGGEREERHARREAATSHLRRLGEEEWTREDTVERMLMQYEFRSRPPASAVGLASGDGGGDDLEQRSRTYQRMVREVLGAQRRRITDLRNEGSVSDRPCSGWSASWISRTSGWRSEARGHSTSAFESRPRAATPTELESGILQDPCNPTQRDLTPLIRPYGPPPNGTPWHARRSTRPTSPTPRSASRPIRRRPRRWPNGSPPRRARMHGSCSRIAIASWATPTALRSTPGPPTAGRAR